MPDLDPAHVAAIAVPLLGRTATSGVRQILTSTDPDVHAALLAALVRAGVLSEELREVCAVCGLGRGECQNIDEACLGAAWVARRRYVTRWEDIP